MEWMLMPLRRYAEFSGRSRRMEFWMFTLGVMILYFLLMMVAMAVGFSATGMASGAGMMGMFASMGVLAIVFLVVWLGLLIPTLAVTVRRLHDTDRSGWWLFLYIGPYLLSMVMNVMAVSSNNQGMAGFAGLVGIVGLIGAIVLLVFYCLPGTPGSNRYGPDPLGGAANLDETFA